MSQRPLIMQLLPLEPMQADEFKHRWDYLYEPDARELINGLVTRFIEAQVYHAVIENHACEQDHFYGCPQTTQKIDYSQ